ncbi:hypothetical protein EBU99_10235, partial [bacterium]|nr:hypothetical protein [bacterium]
DVHNELTESERLAIRAETRRDLIAVIFAVPWQLVLFLLGMVFVLRQWNTFACLALLFVALSAGLYWFWFRHLAESKQETQVEISPAESGESQPVQV